MNHQDEINAALMANGFSALDLQLYIDTHPGDVNAIAMYNERVRELKKAREEYEKMHGTLFSFNDYLDAARSNWIDSPWPWENEEEY